MQKSNGKLYWYGMSSDTLVETDGTGNNPTEFIFFNGRRIARRDSAGVVSYFFADHLGSSRVVTSATGQVLDDSDFYPFGGERAVSSTSGNPYKFTGKERDAESGLDDFGARYYASAYGRFASTDPSAKSVELTNPQSLNRYAYVLNSPLRFVDPNGLWAVDASIPGFDPSQLSLLLRVFSAAEAIATSPEGRRIFGQYKEKPENFVRFGDGPRIDPTKKTGEYGVIGAYDPKSNTILLNQIYLKLASQGSFAAFVMLTVNLLHEQAHASRHKTGAGPEEWGVEDGLLGPGVRMHLVLGKTRDKDKVELVFQRIEGESERERGEREYEAYLALSRLENLIRDRYKAQ